MSLRRTVAASGFVLPCSAALLAQACGASDVPAPVGVAGAVGSAGASSGSSGSAAAGSPAASESTGASGASAGVAGASVAGASGNSGNAGASGGASGATSGGSASGGAGGAVATDTFSFFVTYLAHSNIISAGSTVLSRTQIHSLGVALDAIHARFSPAYGPASGNTGFYAMDCEFKFSDEVDPTQPATLFVKQARPYPGRGN
jgi:hypothetical protein